MEEIQVGQRWTHKLTSLAFRVALIDDGEAMLEPEGDGQELTLSLELLMQEFRCPMIRRAVSQKSQKSKKRIKPGKIRRGARR